MGRRFIEGRRYRWRTIKGEVGGGSDCPDHTLFEYIGGGVFQPALAPFVDGQTYLLHEISTRVWGPDLAHARPETLFVYRAETGGFEEVVERSPHSLIPASEAQAAVEKLLRRGLSVPEVARTAGISVDATSRALAGLGYVRQATATALAAAASMNGKP